jgi:hypothetical protein
MDDEMPRPRKGFTMTKRFLLASIALAACAADPARENFAPEDRIGPPPPEPETVSTQANPIVFGCNEVYPANYLLATLPASGCPAGIGNSESLTGFEYLNRIRRYLGLPCVEGAQFATSAAFGHAAYNSRYYGVTPDTCYAMHDEKPACDGFTGVTTTDRMRAWGEPLTWAFEREILTEDAGCGSSIMRETQKLFAAPFHRQFFMISEMQKAGFGRYCRTKFYLREDCTNVFNGASHSLGSGTATHPISPTFEPMPGSGNVLTNWDGIEDPTPPAPPGGYPSGYPVTIRRPGMTITGTAFCKVESNGTCTHVPHVPLVTGSHPGVQPGFAHLYAHQPLAANTVYRAQFFGVENNAPLAPWWEFRTMP